MSTAVAEAAQPARQLLRPQLLRAAIASSLGTTLVWYDVFLYGFAASLVLGDRFFPSSSPFVSTLTALATYLVGFAARPLGAALFGHMGDRIGRRATLIATLWLMGLATVLVGLVPTYAQIGIAGGVLLTLLRIVQGVAAGGQWAGSVLLSVEWTERRWRGLTGSLTQLAMPAGLLLALGAVQVSAYYVGSGSYWGWRVPFLLGGVLIVVGLYVRIGTSETPVFTKLLDDGKIEQAPVTQAVARQGSEVLLCALARTGQEAPFYLFTIFVIGYATSFLKFQQAEILKFVMIAAAVSLVATPFWGFQSDLLGRKRVCLIGAAAMLVWSFGYWTLLDQGVPLLVFGAIVLALPIHDIQSGPQAALIAESFTARLRYSGASLAYHLAALIAGGPALVIPMALLGAFHHSLPLAIYGAACAAISLGAVALLRDRSGQELSA
ncbi:MAG TPA: MFS transporter [Candidatus Dormibacteraeota bacterium]|nr:MFS transporter [Candidatus Dormibacteraeota bacterium]